MILQRPFTRGHIRTASLATCLFFGCGAPTPRPGSPQPAAPPPVPISFTDDLAPLPRYHSKRLALSIPLPDGSAWVIDDHSRPELMAVHGPTHSKVVVAVVRTDGLVGRTQCETLARDLKIVPAKELSTLDDEVTLTQTTFDTRIRVALDAGNGPESPLIGHVMAFGGFLRKCFIFDFSTEVPRATFAPVLSTRLAFARARILGGLVLDPFGTLLHRDSSGPADEPAR